MKYIFFIVTAIFTIVSCKKNDSLEFENSIINSYKKNDTIRIDKIFNFKWDKLYIFSIDHFPEAKNHEVISKIIGAKYDKDINSDERLLIFVSKGKVVNSMITVYDKENAIDYKPLLVDFFLDDNSPDYFDSKRVTFLIKKENDRYLLYWIPATQSLQL